jgi:hypothetical protein
MCAGYDKSVLEISNRFIAGGGKVIYLNWVLCSLTLAKKIHLVVIQKKRRIQWMKLKAITFEKFDHWHDGRSQSF